MSTLGYASLTNQRLSDPANEGTNKPGTGVKTYVDALSAMVPAEVLAVHSVVLNFLYDKSTGFGSHAPAKLELLFWALMAISCALFVAPRLSGGIKWQKGDWLRALIPPTAFWGWSVLQPISLLDGWWQVGDKQMMSAFVVVLAIVLGILTSILASKAAAANPPPAQ